MCVGSHLIELEAMDPSRDSAILRARRFYKLKNSEEIKSEKCRRNKVGRIRRKNK